MGKRSRSQGAIFERRVRDDLESKGFICDRWTNNVELPYLRCVPMDSITPKEHEKLRCNSQFLDFMQTLVKHDGKTICKNHHYEELGKIIPAKPHMVFNPIIKRMVPQQTNSGFPDFVCFQCGDYKKGIMWSDKSKDTSDNYIVDYDVIAVEVKTNGILSKLEKEKCRWYLDNKIFSKILIAEKTKVKNRIVINYHNFAEKYGK